MKALQSKLAKEILKDTSAFRSFLCNRKNNLIKYKGMVYSVKIMPKAS